MFVTLYGCTLLAIRLLGFALDAYADSEHLYATKADDEERRERRQLLPVVLAYAIAILIGIAFPVAAVWLYLGSRCISSSRSERSHDAPTCLTAS